MSKPCLIKKNNFGFVIFEIFIENKNILMVVSVAVVLVLVVVQPPQSAGQREDTALPITLLVQPV